MAHWVEDDRHNAYCSNCHRKAVYQIVDGKWEYEPFCPHCGEYMFYFDDDFENVSSDVPRENFI